MGWLARVYVTPKTGVLDPQGKAVQHSLHALGYPEVGEVRICIASGRESSAGCRRRLSGRADAPTREDRLTH